MRRVVSFVHYSRACFTLTAITLLSVAIVLPSINAASLIVFDAANSNVCTPCGSLSWSHTTGSGLNRILVVGVSDSDPAKVDGVTYGGTALTLIAAQNGSVPLGRRDVGFG